jgi:hypothetical protein
MEDCNKASNKEKKLNFLEKGGSVIRLCGFVYIPHVGLPDAFI